MKRLDLRKDFADLSAFVAERVKSFDPAANPGPGKGKRVSRIDIGFGLYQSGWACLVFDARRGPEPDGEWNEYIEDTVLERPKWAAACEAVEAGPITLILPDGTRRDLAAGDTGGLVAALGVMLRAVLLQARDDGVLAGLPKAPPVRVGGGGAGRLLRLARLRGAADRQPGRTLRCTRPRRINLTVVHNSPTAAAGELVVRPPESGGACDG